MTAGRRSFWAPTVAFDGNYERELVATGAGSGPTLPGFPDETFWSLSLVAALPLYAGGERASIYRQSSEELLALQLGRDTLAQTIEARIRLAMTRAGTTYPAISLSREAADASAKNLELVTDSYSRGAVSIIDLLDAQNAALVAEQVASNAVYNFLIDLMEVQRSANSIGFLMSQQHRNEFYQRLTRYFAEAGFTRRPPSRGP